MKVMKKNNMDYFPFMLSYRYITCVHVIFHDPKSRDQNWKQQETGLDQMKESACCQETWSINKMTKYKWVQNILWHTLKRKIHWDILNTKTEMKHPAQAGQIFRPGRLHQKLCAHYVVTLTPQAPLTNHSQRHFCLYYTREKSLGCINTPLRNL